MNPGNLDEICSQDTALFSKCGADDAFTQALQKTKYIQSAWVTTVSDFLVSLLFCSIL